MTVTQNGAKARTFNEIYTEIADGLRDIYGSDISLEPDDPDGQRVAILSRLIANNEADTVDVYESFDPDLAARRALDRIIKLAGIERVPPVKSQADLEIETDRDLTLPDGYTVEDQSGNEWETDAEISLTAGTSTITVFAKEFGRIEAGANEIDTPVTIILGVTSVTNPSAATPGRAEETDKELRQRRKRSVEGPATSSIGRILSAVGNVEGVTDIQVYENATDTTDSRGIPPHSFWVVVEGGDVADIIRTIAINRSGGADTKGNITGQYIEELERPDGTITKIVHDMSFDRPTVEDVDVEVTVTRKDSNEPVDTAAIEDALKAREFLIAENMLATQLYATVYSVSDRFFATDLQIKRTSGSMFTDEWLVSDPDVKFNIANVNITEVVP